MHNLKVQKVPGTLTLINSKASSVSFQLEPPESESNDNYVQFARDQARERLKMQQFAGDRDPEKSLYSRYNVWEMCVHREEKKRGKEEEEERKVITRRSAIFLRGSQPDAAEVKISNVNTTQSEGARR